VSVLLLRYTGWWIGWSVCCLAQFGSNGAWLMWFCSHDLLLWNGKEDDNEKQWQVLKIIHLATSQNWTIGSQRELWFQAVSCCGSLQGTSMVQQLVVSWSEVVCVFTKTHRDERLLISHVCLLYRSQTSTEKTTGDVWLKTPPGSYMNHTLMITWCYTLNTRIFTQVMVKTLILLCSNWSNLPTLT
jgi:hypothetical protein